jgi:hypothetical protein
VLDRVRAGALADAGERHLALRAVERRRAHLDQLVVRERAVDLGHHRVAQAFLAELQNRVQGVRARAQGLALGRREHGRHVARRVGHLRPSAAQGDHPPIIIRPWPNRARRGSGGT